MATILYARVSTVEQTIEHQLSQAKAAGFAIDDVVSDNGVSGIATRLSERPQGKRLFDKLRAGDVLVVRWVDRLGRNYDDVCATIRAFMERGVIIRTVINGMTFDGATQDPVAKAVRDALIGFMAATAQARPKPRRPLREPESNTPRAARTHRTLVVSRRTRGRSSLRFARCSARGQRVSPISRRRPG
jgi:DNA invertase Pin-like site-specific DNA recombinase